jgi:hypothetical protein
MGCIAFWSILFPGLYMRIAGLVVSVAISVITACTPVHVVSTPAPMAVPGDHIRYTGRSDTTNFITARAVSIDADSLVFERFVAGDPSGRWVRGSLLTDSIGVLQVRVGRRANPGRGALIGTIAGGAIGLLCAVETSSGWLEPSPEACVLGYTIMGAGTGLVIGALRRSDVWAPTALPRRRPEPTPANPPVAAAPVWSESEFLPILQAIEAHPFARFQRAE